MKIIFLDIDGVLVLKDDPTDTKYGRHNMFDPRCVEALNDIWRFTGCELVISSDWCYTVFPSLQGMRNFFTHNGVLAPIIGFVDKSRRNNITSLEEERRTQISEWVGIHDPESWIAIDDLELGFGNRNRHVQTTHEEGLAAYGIKDTIIELLKFSNY